MNNKGQTLVLFVIVLPVILFGICFFVDSSMVVYENHRLEKLTDDLIHYEDELNNNDKIEEFLKKNDKKVKVEVTDETIKLEKKINSIFGHLIGVKEYNLKIEKERSKKGE